MYEQEEVSSKYGGNGLGLYISKKLVELPGNITIDSIIGKEQK